MHVALRETEALAHISFAGKPSPRQRSGPRLVPVPLRVWKKHHDELEPQVLQFLSWMLPKLGLNLYSYRLASITRRIGAMLRALRVDTLAEAQALIEIDKAMLAKASDALLIGVTHFFRDAAVFQFLKESVVPELGNLKEIRCWSAGCADGAELYSMAMLLDERQLLSRSCLLGTDLRENAIIAAGTGAFQPDALRELPEDLKSKYFETRGQFKTIIPWLSAHTEFRVSNLLDQRQPGQWDVILCRNLTIYLNPRAAEQLWCSLLDSMRPGAFLITGKAESPLPHPQLRRVCQCVFRKS